MTKKVNLIDKEIGVVMPANNEAEVIGGLINSIKKIKLIKTIIVIDDGSTDNTAWVAKKAGAKVLRTHINMGSGPATLMGILEAQKCKCDFVITMDADGQHAPEYITNMIRQTTSDVNCVIASRYLKKTDHVTSFVRRCSTKIISLLIGFVYGKAISDPTSGFRIYNKEALKYLITKYPLVFSEPEIVIDFIKKRFKIKEISIQMKPRLYGSSKTNLKKAVFLMAYITKVITQDFGKRLILGRY